jgi:DnaJ-class molecular chaperone
MAPIKPKVRVPVPGRVQSQLREIQRSAGSIRKAIEFLQCSIATFEDATSECATLRPETLEKLEKKIKEWTVVIDSSCPRCGGEGATPDDAITPWKSNPCSLCDGDGRVESSIATSWIKRESGR